MSWWVHSAFESAGGGTAGATVIVSWIFWVLASITLHELGHGVAAIVQGDETPRETGHMTANPLVHMGGMSMIVFFLIGIAWGLMPVNPSRFSNQRWGRVFVALAGPVVNLVLFLFCAIALAVVARAYGAGDGDLDGSIHIMTFLKLGAELNFVLLAFNLLPIPPLDGWQVIAGLSYRARMIMNHPNASMISLGVILVLIVSNALNAVWLAGRESTLAVVKFILGLL